MANAWLELLGGQGKTRAGTPASPTPLDEQLGRTTQRIKGFINEPEEELKRAVYQYLPAFTDAPEEKERKLEEFYSGFLGGSMKGVKPYGVAQEGAFYRVRPESLKGSGARARGNLEARGESPDIAAGASRGDVPEPHAGETFKDLTASQNFPLEVADKYSRKNIGRQYSLPAMSESSLAKQSAIGKTFELAASDNPQYKKAVFAAYKKKFPKIVERANAKDYDDLMEKAYLQLAKETEQQFLEMPINMSYHRAGEGNYRSSAEMLHDVHKNKHLYVFQGGDPHDFLNAVDPRTGLNTNEMFRAVHDFFGHAVHGTQFGPKGEELAWLAHSQMFSPLARLAMTSETRGQNSFVNYTPINAQLKKTLSSIEEELYEAKRRGRDSDVNRLEQLKAGLFNEFQFAPQKSVLLPPEFTLPTYEGGMPAYVQSLIKPKAGTTTQTPLTHFSTSPNLTMTDPNKYGTGIAGEEAARLEGVKGAVKPRTYFYAGEPGEVTPEVGLGPHRYRAEGQTLYNLAEDPLNLRILAAESNRVPFTAQANAGLVRGAQSMADLERMIKEYGYEGYLQPGGRSPAAAIFQPKPVERKAEGGLAEGGVPEKRDVSQLFPIRPELKGEPMARTRAGVPVQDTNVLGGALQGLGETLLGAGRGYTATALGGVQDLLNMVDIPKIMTGESYQIPYGSEYFKDVLPLKPTTQTGEVAQELGSFLPVDPTQVAKAGYKTAKTVGKAIAPTAAEMALDLAEKGGTPVRQFAVPPEGKLSKEEYSRMMREKYAAENAARAAKKEAAPVTMGDLKPKEEKVPADKLGFYSPAEKAAANLKRNIADGELMLSDLKKFPDVTPDELEATGLEQWLKGKKTVTKQQVKDYIAKNKIELEEVKYEQGTGNADDMRFGSGEVIDDYDYISSRADDIMYEWEHYGDKTREEIRDAILENVDPDEAEHLIVSGKIDDLVDNEIRDLAEQRASDEYYDNPYRRYRNDMGYEIVGNDDVGYHVTDPRGNYVRMNREAYDVETAEGYARQDAMENGYLYEGETKYHDYQLPGGENYREILLKTPSKKQKLEEEIASLEYSLDNSGNDPREVREMQKELDRLKEEYKYAENNDYEGSHWDEPNVVAHLRLQDRVDSEGNKILYVDEMQSDWHQEGRRKGYKTKEDSELLAKAVEKYNEAAFRQNIIWNNRVERSRELAKEFADSQDPAVKALGSTKYMEKDKILNDLDNAYNEASKVTSALNQELNKYTNKVPKGPFADNWHKLALKRVMKYAADNGYTRVGFSKAQPQVNRWGTDVVAWDKNPAGGWVVTATEQRGGRAGNINLEDDARARGILQESRVNTINNRDQLYATVAKIGRGKTEEELQKLTDRIWKQMQEKDAGIVAPREAGMKKFYDEELEGALKKYANQFKGKYGQTTINVPREGTQTINYIDITPNLKNSTTKGQPYKVGGAVKMADGGPVNLDNLLAQAIENAQPKSLDHLLHQAMVKSYAEGGAAYNTTPDMADGGQFIQGEAF